MLQSVRMMKNLNLSARDGRIGHVEEFYFDDTHFTIRYLVAQAGNWLTGRMVLLSPHVLGKPDAGHRAMPVNLTRDEIRHSPAPESDRPVSRQFEEDYYKYFGWPYYWAGPYLWGPSPFPALPPVPADAAGASPQADRSRSYKGNPHVRSTDEMTGYQLHARDGGIGHIEDFLYEEGDWAIHYLVVDTRNWWPGKKVLIPPSWIGGISWEARTIDVEASREDIRQAPEYDPARPITPESEKELARYYETSVHRV